VKVIDLHTREELRPEGVARAGDDVTRTLQAMRGVLRGSGDLLPDDEAIVGAVLGAALGAERAGLRAHLDALVQQGLLRRVFVGSEGHLALASSPREPAAPGGVRDPALDPAPAPLDVEIFQTRLKIDMESERVLLYRVGIVVFTILAFVLLRAVVLDLLGY
jgi:hypothetical protein